MMVNITMTMNTYIASRIIIDSVTCNIFIAVCATALLDIVVLFLCFSSWLIPIWLCVAVVEWML